MRRTGYEGGHVPNPEAPFRAMMARLGISDATRVVVYDERGGIYAARLWWILNYFGHPNVALMNGGWTKWTADHHPETASTPSVAPGRFTPRPQPKWLATASDVVAAIDKPGSRIVEARTANEINGQHIGNVRRGGFVPSSVPVYWEDLLDPKLRTFKSADELAEIYRSRGVMPTQQVIVYCLVGMRASVDCSRCT